MTGRDRATPWPTLWPTVGFLIAALVVSDAAQGAVRQLFSKRSAILAWASWSFSHPEGTLTTPQLIAVAVAGFYLGVLFDDVTHRLFNHSRLFWWTHEYHHLPCQVFVAMPGLLIRPFAPITYRPFPCRSRSRPGSRPLQWWLRRSVG